MAAVTRKNMIPVALAVLAIVILLPVAVWIGLTGENRGTSVHPNPTQNISTVAAFPAAPQGATIVQLKDLKFQPGEVSVEKGRPVAFVNADQTQHEVLINSEKVDSGPLDPGKTFTWTPDKPGTYTLTCRIHPTMGGSVTVQ